MSTLMSDDDLIDYDLLKKLKERNAQKLIITKEMKVFKDIIDSKDITYMEFMIWLKENGYLLHTELFIIAAKSGNLEDMKWLKDNGCLFDNYVFDEAALFGNLDNMKWLK